MRKTRLRRGLTLISDRFSIACHSIKIKHFLQNISRHFYVIPNESCSIGADVFLGWYTIPSVVIRYIFLPDWGKNIVWIHRALAGGAHPRRI